MRQPQLNIRGGVGGDIDALHLHQISCVHSMCTCCLSGGQCLCQNLHVLSKNEPQHRSHTFPVF